MERMVERKSKRVGEGERGGKRGEGERWGDRETYRHTDMDRERWTHREW